MGKTNTDLVSRILPSIVAWGVTQLLEVKPVKRSLQNVDRKVEHHRGRATEAVRQARDNAMMNGVWLAAGIVSIVAGAAFIVRATRSK